MNSIRMTSLHGFRRSRPWLGILLALGAVSGCATTATEEPETSAPAANIEVVDEVGFTITEQLEVNAEADFAYHEALRLLEQGMVDEGIAKLEEVAKAAPGVAAPQIDLGVAYHIADDLAAAEEHLQQALEINPDHPVAHNELGIVYRKTGRFAQARKEYEAALAIYPGYHFARRNLAILCDLYLADSRCALDNYEAYMGTVPNDEEVEIWIADLRARMGN